MQKSFPVANSYEDGAQIRATLHSDGSVEIQPLAVGLPYRSLGDAMAAAQATVEAVRWIAGEIAERKPCACFLIRQYGKPVDLKRNPACPRHMQVTADQFTADRVRILRAAS